MLKILFDTGREEISLQVDVFFLRYNFLYNKILAVIFRKEKKSDCVTMHGQKVT